MFERYTEHGRRAVYFAKYEAAQAGSRSIDPEHLALGLLWDAYPLAKYLNSSAMTLPHLREKLGVRSKCKKPLSMEDEIPLSMSSKKILRESAMASDELGQRHIGPEHLMLALLEVKKSFLDKIFLGGCADLNSLRNRIAKVSPPPARAAANGSSVTVTSVLESLTTGVEEISLPYLADELQSEGVDGNLHLGRNGFVESKKDVLGAISGKTLAFKVEDEEKKSSGIRICTLLWREPQNIGKLNEERLRMTALFSVRNDCFSVFLIQVSSSAASSTKGEPSN